MFKESLLILPLTKGTHSTKKVHKLSAQKATIKECRPTNICKCRPCMQCFFTSVCLACDSVMRTQEAEAQLRRASIWSNLQSPKWRWLRGKAEKENAAYSSATDDETQLSSLHIWLLCMLIYVNPYHSLPLPLNQTLTDLNESDRTVFTWHLRHCRRLFFLGIFTSELFPYLRFRSSQPLILPRSTVALIRRLTSLAVPFIYIPQARLQKPTGIYRQTANSGEKWRSPNNSTNYSHRPNESKLYAKGLHIRWWSLTETVMWN